MTSVLPDKLYFKIGEVARVAGVATSVLRFWETEFGFLKPEKSTTGQRLYTKREVELVLEVKKLLYTEKFTIEGVKRRINSRGRMASGNINDIPAVDPAVLLKEIKTELQALRGRL